MKYMEIAVKQANKSLKYVDVPVGAIIVYNNKVIGKGYNNRTKTYKTINHAEINAINKANKYIKDWRLNKCTMYVTLKPCNMCLEVIKEARIDKVYYLLDKEENQNDEILCKYDDKILESKYKETFQNFFKKNCKR